jgi:predicted O-methyltransferase YrrM
MDDFLEYNSWFDEMFRAKLASRYPTFRVALNLLYQLPLHRIVETGTIRRARDYSAGYSTFVFGHFVKRYGGKITTIDIDSRHMNVCKRVTAEFADWIEYVVDDSLHALSLLHEPIDLLYLDSLDTPIRHDATHAQLHNLKEFKLAEPLLHEKSIVLIDDNNFANGGKSRMTKHYLHEKGWRLLLNLRQSVWIR